MFTPPRPNDKGQYELDVYATPTLTDLRNLAAADQSALVASIDKDSPDEEILAQAEELTAFVAAADLELDKRAEKSARASAQKPIQARTVTEPVVEPETVTADANGLDADGNKDVAQTTPAVPVASASTEVVAATVTASGSAPNAPTRSVQISDVAPHSPAADIPEGSPGFTIVAAADLADFSSGTELSWAQVGKAFEDRVRAYPSAARGGAKTRMQHSLVRIRRDFPETQIVMEGDSHEQAFAKLRGTADDYSNPNTRDAVVAANGWCAPSEPDYSICSPITSDGLLNLPEMVLRRGGLLHNQGLDFADFFGGDFVLPIPGFNILTEAQVIADTAKTCVEIPCPAFVDDRLNVAALCLTSSLLQNRGYPEFVAEFTQGAIAALAHLVNREVVNEIETGSTAIVLSTLDPWATDGSVWSQLMSAIDMVAMNVRYMYRTSQTQTVQLVFPYWVRTGLRADWLRRNATHTEELTDQMIDAALARRNVQVQWIYDWQDAFDPANGAGAIDVNHQFGNSAGPIAAALFNMPTSVTFLAFLPGTWILGRQDVIRLDTVYDSTNLAQNLVTQLFMEDGFKPMKMCQFSFAYTINICANGSTGVQRAVTCSDVTP
jgi:hypothetical protein